MTGSTLQLSVGTIGKRGHKGTEGRTSYKPQRDFTGEMSIYYYYYYYLIMEIILKIDMSKFTKWYVLVHTAYCMASIHQQNCQKGVFTKMTCVTGSVMGTDF